MNKKKPLITIITVTFNAHEHLEKTIQSVIDQKYENIEYLIIDGDSTEGTLDIIKRYEQFIHYWISEPDKGIYDAMNKGIKQAKGEWLFFLNAGDTLIGNIIKKVFSVPVLNYKLIYGYIFNQKNNQYQWGEYNKFRLSYRSIPHPASFFHKNLFKNSQYDLKYTIASDYAFFLKAMKKTKSEDIKYINLPIANFQADGVSSYKTDFPFFNDKQKLIKENLGSKVLDYYHDGVYFFDILQFLDKQNFILWFDSSNELKLLKKLTHKINQSNHIRKTENKLKYQFDVSEQLNESLDNLNKVKTATNSEYWHIVFNKNKKTIQTIINYGFSSDKIVIFRPYIFSHQLHEIMQNKDVKNVIIFGTSNAAKAIVTLLKSEKTVNKIKIKFFFDNNPKKWNQRFNGISIKKPDFKHITQQTTIVIASQWQIEIRQQLCEMGVNNKQIIDSFY